MKEKLKSDGGRTKKKRGRHEREIKKRGEEKKREEVNKIGPIELKVRKFQFD